MTAVFEPHAPLATAGPVRARAQSCSTGAAATVAAAGREPLPAGREPSALAATLADPLDAPTLAAAASVGDATAPSEAALASMGSVGESAHAKPAAPRRACSSSV